MSKQNSIWNDEHVDFLMKFDQEQTSNSELAVAMSKHFKMRVTTSQVSRLLSQMRTVGDRLYRKLPYREKTIRRRINV